MMTEETIKRLLESYQNATCTPAEKQLVEDFLDSYQEKYPQWHTWKYGDQQETQTKILHNILHEIDAKENEINRLDASRMKLTKGGHRSGATGSQRVLIRYVAAAAIAIIASIAFFFYTPVMWFTAPGSPEPVTKTTQRGQKSNIVLSDGTTIRLNAESSLTFPEKFTDGKREVTLTGEAFFDVAENPTQPFIVHTAALTTTVLGTTFNVNAYKETPTTITVATGKVKVEEVTSPRASESSGTKDVVAKFDETVLTANQQLTYNPETQKTIKKTTNATAECSWKDNTITFNHIPLSEAALILERWFNVTITFENEALKHCLIRSEYHNENLLNILESIKFIQGIGYRFTDNNRIIISGTACSTQTPKKLMIKK